MPTLTEPSPIDSLPFRVDPHMLEDLGLNLYTNLPRVLVEFIANAYDADARSAEVSIDFDTIRAQRGEMRKAWRIELEQPDGDHTAVAPLEDRALPETTAISIQDDGHGMTVEDLRDKFLVAGRRRRIEEQSQRTHEQRVLMGRKGVGKLAGFGVARTIEVVSKVAGEERAHRIRLDFDRIMKLDNTSKVEVPAFELSGDGGLGEQGTRVTLSKLVHESVTSREQTVRQSIGDHFVLIHQDDFAIRLNGTPADPTPRKIAFAWPEPSRPVEELVEHHIPPEDSGQPVDFSYRLRFVEDRSSLLGSERGVRVYAHKRLAAAPSLLHADTNMHGFRMTDYLDGVVHADFIDSLDRDYIATDRQGLRWETALLQPVHNFLGEQIKEACKEYQRFRDKRKEKDVVEDEFTQTLVESAQLSRRERRLAAAICVKLASFHKGGVESDEYREHAGLLVGAVGKGEIFTAISKIAAQAHPALHDLAGEVGRLTHAEIDQVLGGMRARVLAIEALQGIVKRTDFSKGNNENELHSLLKKSPWLIDPTYFEFLTSNRAADSVFSILETRLKIGEHVPGSYDKEIEDETEPLGKNRRPDLVFLLGSTELRRLVIVELKAPNTPLHNTHLVQLKDYMRDANAFFRHQQQLSNMVVEGRLIGTLDLSVNSIEIDRLKEELDDGGPTTKWAVYGLADLLDRTCAAHKEFLGVYREENGEPGAA